MTELSGVILVRHAPTPANNPENERLRGRLDGPVDKAGRQVAQQRAEFFKGLPIKRIFHDGLIRCLVMATAIHKVTPGSVLIKDMRVAPWRMGILQGTPVEQGEKRLDYYMFRAPDEKIPEGESYNEFKDRFLKFLQVHRHDEGSACVTHLRNLITAAAWAQGGARGVSVDLGRFRNYQPFKKFELTYIDPQGRFAVLEKAATEEAMVKVHT